MQELLSCLFPDILFGGLFILGGMYLGDYIGRRRRETILNTLRNKNEPRRYISAFAHPRWMRAELCITQDCIYYFGYHKIFGLRIYRSAMQLALPKTESTRLIAESGYYIIESANYSNGVWKLLFNRPLPGLSSGTYTILLSDLPLDSIDFITEFCQRVASLSQNESI